MWEMLFSRIWEIAPRPVPRVLVFPRVKKFHENEKYEENCITTGSQL